MAVMSTRKTRSKVVSYSTLKVKRVHVTTCVSFGTDEDCPSRSKKKCPFWLTGYGRDEGGRLVRVRESLKVSDLKLATQKMHDLLLGNDRENEREPAITIDEAIRRFLAEQN